MHYADSSFLVSLVSSDSGTDAARDELRAMGRPTLCFCDLHEMEVRNTLRAIEFVDVANSPASKLAEIKKQRHRAEARLNHMLRGAGVRRVSPDAVKLLEQFEKLSSAHTAKLGTRTLDVIHVATAILLKCKDFITCDIRQAALAKAAGLKVRLVEIDG